MKVARLLPWALGLLIASAPFVSCSDDNNNGPDDPVIPDQPTEPVFSELEPFMKWGVGVPEIKKLETRNLRTDTTVVRYGYQTIRTLIYDGREHDIAFYYYYNFLHAELYETQMLCPKVPEVTEKLDSIFNAEYKYWRWDDVNTCDVYLTPDTSMMVRKEIWTGEDLPMDLYRVVYLPTSPEEIKKYYEK